jgi:hypothetical protein
VVASNERYPVGVSYFEAEEEEERFERVEAAINEVAWDCQLSSCLVLVKEKANP